MKTHYRASPSPQPLSPTSLEALVDSQGLLALKALIFFIIKEGSLIRRIIVALDVKQSIYRLATMAEHQDHEMIEQLSAFTR